MSQDQSYIQKILKANRKDRETEEYLYEMAIDMEFPHIQDDNESSSHK